MKNAQNILVGTPEAHRRPRGSWSISKWMWGYELDSSGSG